MHMHGRVTGSLCNSYVSACSVINWGRTKQPYAKSTWIHTWVVLHTINKISSFGRNCNVSKFLFVGRDQRWSNNYKVKLNLIFLPCVRGKLKKLACLCFKRQILRTSTYMYLRFFRAEAIKSIFIRGLKVNLLSISVQRVCSYFPSRCSFQGFSPTYLESLSQGLRLVFTRDWVGWSKLESDAQGNSTYDFISYWWHKLDCRSIVSRGDWLWKAINIRWWAYFINIKKPQMQAAKKASFTACLSGKL